jgi:hypothetical protein
VNAFALCRREGSREQFFSSELDALLASLRTAPSPRARARPLKGCAKILLLPPKKPVDLLRLLAADRSQHQARGKEQPDISDADDIPKWQLVDTDWHMIVGSRTVALLLPNSDNQFPRYRWLSCIVCDDCEAFGWDGLDFETLEAAQADIEQWWTYACRGEAYRP